MLLSWMLFTTEILDLRDSLAKIRQFTIQYAWSLGRWEKRIVDQASDVPSIIFFHDCLQNSLQKSSQFIFLIFL